MGIGISSISLSKYTILVAAQLVINVSLAVWLYNEYLHNPFMQAYVSNVWSAILPGVAVAAGVAAGAACVVGAFLVYNRRRLGMIPEDEDAAGEAASVASTSSLETLDVCPFCETPLKTISEGRLQCRSCRRYFKSGLPKVSA
jgi:hypothetical protein